MIEAMSHITLIVRDIERAAQMLCAVFDAREVYDSKGRNFSLAREKFFIIGHTWIALMDGESVLERSYNHVAFKVADEELDAYAARVRALGLEVLPGRARVPGEGRSLYFYDYDNHLFELHTGTLEERLRHYRAS